MNRNQKIALGCGGGGCLGLILLVILGVVLVVTGVIKAPGLYSPSSNSNYNSNRNSNFNSSYNRNTNANSNTTSSSSTMSEDDKHKLFQAGAVTRDAALNRRVWDKLGFLNSDGSPNDEYGTFVRDHIAWLFKNTGFVQTINTPEKARAYVNEHIDD